MQVELLGKTVTDSITGFSGVVTGHVEYLTGCNQCLVQPRAKSDGGWTDSQWIDDDRLDIQDSPTIKLSTRRAGHDKEAPRR